MSSVMLSSRVVIPDEGNSSRGVAEAGLEESVAHNLVRDHQGCQGLTDTRLVQTTLAALEQLTGSSMVRGSLRMIV